MCQEQTMRERCWSCKVLERDFSLGAGTGENCPVSCLWSSAGGTVSLTLGGRSQWYCMCTSQTPLMHRLLTFPRLLTRQGRDGNMTGLVQPSQIKVAVLQAGEIITEEKVRINEPKLS